MRFYSIRIRTKLKSKGGAQSVTHEKTSNMKKTITIKPHEENERFVDVFVNGECVGCVITDGTLTAKEAYTNLKSNWEIDRMEAAHYEAIDRSLDY